MRMHRSTESLRRAIDARRGQAEMLLTIATHHATREQVHLALRDLDEAVTWLDRDSSISPVDRLFDLAAWRLDTIRYALRDEGADAATPHTVTASNRSGSDGGDPLSGVSCSSRTSVGPITA